MFRKEIYLPFLLSILLFLSIDISFYNYIVLGKEDDSKDNVKEEKEERDDNRDSKDNVKEEKEEDFEDISLDELFEDNNADDNRDSKDNVKEEKEEEDEVPFLLPFNAVPFP
ncbi:MAG: hypothetical protein ACXW07_04400 [Nitrososphaeraceae archaeon]